VKKALAKPEPSTHGTFRTWSDVRLESVVRAKADSADCYKFMGPRPNSATPDGRCCCAMPSFDHLIGAAK
jgi:hypothetical protein